MVSRIAEVQNETLVAAHPRSMRRSPTRCGRWNRSCVGRCAAPMRTWTNWCATGVCWAASDCGPALLLLSRQGVRRGHAQHLTLAAVVEMVHTATLVHDDVLDEARVRRHLATVNARWDNEASVLLGDYPVQPRVLPGEHAGIDAGLSTDRPRHECRVRGRDPAEGQPGRLCAGRGDVSSKSWTPRPRHCAPAVANWAHITPGQAHR